MQWWNNFLNWLSSDDGWRVLTAAVFPFIAIVVAGIIGALIGRGATRRLITHQDRELQASAIAAMIESGRAATMWSSLATGAQAHSDSQFNAADIRIRLLPLSGASAAADWATHEVRAMRRDSAGFSFQAEQTFGDYRDRLLEWQRRPGRARKLFALDLERFRFEDSSADNELVGQQRKWAVEQAAAEQAAVTPDEPVATPTVAASAPVAPVAPVVEPVPVAAPAAEPVAVPAASAPTQAYTMPVAASAHVNESDPTPEPHVESEEDPEDEFEGVAIAEPVEHGEPSGYDEPSVDDEPVVDDDSAESAETDAESDQDREAERERARESEQAGGTESADYNSSGEWQGQPTQAMPLIEPSTSYAPSSNNYTSPDTGENRTL